METMKLNIKRDNSMTGGAMPYRIIVDGKEEAKLTFGKSLSLEIPQEQTTLKVSMVGNTMTFHKIEKEIVIFPQYCKTNIVNCSITTKINWLGYLTLGLLQAMGRTEINVEYC